MQRNFLNNLFTNNPLTNYSDCGIIYTVKGNTPREREETIMTITTIVCTILAITLIAGYAVLLHNSKEPELNDEELAEVSVEREWWNAN